MRSIILFISLLPSVYGRIGFVDSASCTSIWGWAADPARLNQSTGVELVEGGVVVASVTANVHRPDVGAYLKDNGLHGFLLTVPATLKNGAARQYTIRHAGTTTPLTGSPVTLTCGTPPTPPPPPTSLPFAASTGLVVVEVPGQLPSVGVDGSVVMMSSGMVNPCRPSTFAEDQLGNLFYCNRNRVWRRMRLE